MQTETTTSPAPRFATSECLAPSITLATLRAVLADLEPLHGQRAVRAANIVACRAIEPSYSPGGWYVQSESDPDTDYIVLHVQGLDRWTCSCRDWQNRGESIGCCKHILSIKILRECEAREQGPEPPPLPLPFLEDDPDQPISYVLTDAALAELDVAAA